MWVERYYQRDTGSQEPHLRRVNLISRSMCATGASEKRTFRLRASARVERRGRKERGEWAGGEGDLICLRAHFEIALVVDIVAGEGRADHENM